jgi:hypothetical protein
LAGIPVDFLGGEEDASHQYQPDFSGYLIAMQEVDFRVLLLTATIAIGLSCAVTAVVLSADDDEDDYEDEVVAETATEISAVEKESLFCPLTGERMTDPVCTCDGHSYERSAILQWFKSNTTSPRTNQ